MGLFIVRRLGLLAVTAVGLTTLAFWIPRFTGADPCITIKTPVGSPAYLACIERYNLDAGLLEQFGSYIAQLFHGDLGISMKYQHPVMELWLDQFPATLELSTLALLLAVVVGIPAGTIAALRPGSATDRLILGAALTGYSLPIFWSGLLLLMLFTDTLPQGGRLDLIYELDLATGEPLFEMVTGVMPVDTLLAGEFKAFASAVRHLILPTVTLATIPLAVITRQTRSAMLDVQNADYIRTAHAKGLPQWRVQAIHALRGALVTVATTIGLQMSVLLAGAVLTEYVFSRPGIGELMIDAVKSRDYAVVQSGILLIAGMVMLINLLVDLFCGMIDPRFREDAA